MSDLLSAARTAVNQCLGAKRGEKFLVITDEPLRPIGRAEQPRRTGLRQRHYFSPSGRLRTMVFRDAVATMSPC